MEVPFSGIELTFIIIAFVIFSLYSLASVFIQPQEVEPDYCQQNLSRKKHKLLVTN
uniref:Small integral membrane protein 31 n=1 Tax=Acanthochromis polyacanthus TaxID=80966 RepID=A0A3Q1EN52_9TELE